MGRLKRNSACHHCRKAHKKCSGDRPCTKCKEYGRNCFDYDANSALLEKKQSTPSSATKQAKRKQSTVTTTTSQSSEVSSEPTLLLGRGTPSTSSPCESVISKSPATVHQTLAVNNNNTSGSPLPSRHVQQPPTIRINYLNLQMVDYNPAFQQLFGPQIPSIQQNCFHIFPLRWQELWKEIVSSLLKAHVRSVTTCIIAQLPNNKEAILHSSAERHNSYVTIHFQKVHYYNDHWTIDETVLPETLKIESILEQHVPALIIPMHSFDRVFKYLDLINNRHRLSPPSLYKATNDSCTMNSSQITPSISQIDLRQPMFRPIHLTTEELEKVSVQMTLRANNNSGINSQQQR